MPLLIDGYNLLNATGIVGRGGTPSLGRSRLALLNFLAASIDPRELGHTTVVFDAHDAPPGLPRVVQHGPLLVRFAVKNRTADELIEELIRSDFAPRRLVVVSSDHEIQRATQRRRAKAVNSETWYSDLIRARRRAKRSRPTLRRGLPFRCWKRTSVIGYGSSAASRNCRRCYWESRRRPPRRRRPNPPSKEAQKTILSTIPSRRDMARISWRHVRGCLSTPRDCGPGELQSRVYRKGTEEIAEKTSQISCVSWRQSPPSPSPRDHSRGAF